MRNRPRHILSPYHAYSDNFYGLIAREPISPVAWLGALNSTAACIEILSRSRNQGNGLAKVQLFEYRNVYFPDLRMCSRYDVGKFEQLGLELLDRDSPSGVLRRIDELVAAVFADSRLKLPTLYNIFAETDEKARKPKEAATCLG
jgi:adenine-specific DNA-methyltransferase